MSKKKNSAFGLEVTHNSKVGTAFSLPRSKSCIYKTEACFKVCYGNGIRYQSISQKEKRERNFRTVEFLLQYGGPALLADNLIILIDQARPIDWIASTITGQKTHVPWTFRIHDIGDFYSSDYIQAWIIAVAARPDCSFWFYTRSFEDDSLFVQLSKLAGLANCSGWLSLDRDNYNEGLIRYYESVASTWRLALLQEQESLMPPDTIPHLSYFTGNGDLLSFPKHHAGRHVNILEADNLVVCPQIIGTFELEPRANQPKPCQLCARCLP